MREKKLVGLGERITGKMGDMSINDLAAKIDKSYEMTRRYVKGWAMPTDPAVIERIAKALNTSVGYLLSDEANSQALPPLVRASDIHGPVAEPTRVVIEDAAMTMTVDNIRLFGIGDHAVVAPRRHLPGDIVLVQGKNGATLRRYDGEKDQSFSPKDDNYATLHKAAVLGVVTSVYGHLTRGG